jgi:cardiolipin synthase
MLRSCCAVVLASLLMTACSSSSATAVKGDAGAGAPVSGGSDGGAKVDGGGETAGIGDDGARGSTSLTLVTEPGQGLTPIYDLIGAAKKTLDMTMYELTDTTATGLLAQAVKNGVTVRVILDQNLEMHSNTKAYNALAAAGVTVHWANPTYAATHQKAITIDGATSAIMTLNLTPEYYTTSRDFAVITTDAADVAAIESTFEADFASMAVTPGTGDDLVWSPTNAQGSMLDVINQAKATLLVENEEMSDSDIVSALGGAAGRGVVVEVVMTASSSWENELTTLKTAGVKVVTYASNAALYIHAKVIVADDGASGGRVFIGSENFSNASLTENRELGLITSDAAIMASIQASLTSDFAGGTAF